MAVQTLNQNSFEQAIKNNDKIVVVDFYADWCGPCKMIAPVLDEIANEYAETVSVYKVNVDENPGIASQFSVMSIPNLISFKNGEVYKRVVGAQPKEGLLDLIQ